MGLELDWRPDGTGYTALYEDLKLRVFSPPVSPCNKVWAWQAVAVCGELRLTVNQNRTWPAWQGAAQACEQALRVLDAGQLATKTNH